MFIVHRSVVLFLNMLPVLSQTTMGWQSPALVASEDPKGRALQEPCVAGQHAVP